jgi:hypothetical protein
MRTANPQTGALTPPFLPPLWEHSSAIEPFERGNLDAGRLSWLFGREVIAAQDPFDLQSYQALLKVDVAVAKTSFPDIFAEG